MLAFSALSRFVRNDNQPAALVPNFAGRFGPVRFGGCERVRAMATSRTAAVTSRKKGDLRQHQQPRVGIEVPLFAFSERIGMH